MQMYKVQKCPQCLKIGKSSQLQTYQINFQEAIVLCENNKCTYPLDEDNSKSTCETFQRNFSDIQRHTTDRKLLESQHALQNKVVSHLKKNGHKLQNDDIGIQTGSTRIKKKLKCSQSWRKHHSSSSSTITTTTSSSSNFDKFNTFDTKRHIEGLYDKRWNACTGSDGASDKDSSNSSQHSIDTINHNNTYFTNVQSINSCTKSVYYNSFQFNNETNIDSNNAIDNIVLDNNNISQSACKSFDNVNVQQKNIDVVKQEDNKLHEGKTQKSVVKCKSSKLKRKTADNSGSIKSNCTTTGKNVENKIMYFPQWRNCDALCWLDVILCLTVHNKTLRHVVDEESLNSSDIIYKLVKAHQQAYCLINQCSNSSSKQSTVQKVDNEPQCDSIIKRSDTSIAQCKTTTNNLDTSLSCDNIVHTSSSSSVDRSSTNISPVTTNTETMNQICNILNDIREEVWKILYTRLKCTKGKPESPVFAFPLLLGESSVVENTFKMDYRFIYKCRECNYEESSHHINTLPTLPAVCEDFCINIPQHYKTCCQCGNTKDTRLLQYEKLSECVLMHFTEGLPHTDFDKLQLCFHGNKYTVTGVVEYKRSPDHFVAWLRNPADNVWIQCDDLTSILCRYQRNQPSFQSKQVHIVMWERYNQLTTDNICKPTSYSQCSNEILANKKLPDSLVDYFGGKKIKYNGIKCNSKKSRKLNISSNSSCNSSLSTTSSDSLHLPNFVSLTPVVSCDLLKPEPRQINTLSCSLKQDYTKSSSSTDGKNSLYSELSKCHIEGEKMALLPSSVFHTVKSVQPNNTTSVLKGHNSSLSNSNNISCISSDSLTSQHKDEHNYNIDHLNDDLSYKHEDLHTDKHDHKMKISKDDGLVAKYSSDIKSVKSSPIKKNNVDTTEYNIHAVETKIGKDTGLSGVKTKTKNVSTGASMFRKASFKLPTSSKKSTISKDAFFTLDPKQSKCEETGICLKDKTTLNSTRLKGDVSVLNSVKQYLISRTTDRSSSKYKFKGMDLKTCSRESSCSDLELPTRTSTSSSHGALLSSGNTSESVLSSSSMLKGYSLSTNKPVTENKQKRQLDDVIQHECNKKTKLSTLYDKNLYQSHTTSTNLYQDNMKENCTFIKDSDMLQSNRSKSDKCIYQTDDSKCTYIDTETESRNSNISDSKTETSILHDLYDALNLPYNTIQESLSECIDVQDILDNL